jgi:hypothetical protein
MRGHTPTRPLVHDLYAILPITQVLNDGCMRAIQYSANKSDVQRDTYPLPTCQTVVDECGKVAYIGNHAVLNTDDNAFDTTTHYSARMILGIQITRYPAPTVTEHDQREFASSGIGRVIYACSDLGVDLLLA